MKGGKNAMGIVITVLIFGLIGWVEGAHLWRDAPRRDVVTFGICLFLGLILAFLVALNRPLPNVAAWIDALFAWTLPWLGLE